MGVPCDDVGLQQCFFHEPWRACRTWLAGEVQGRPDPALLRRVLRKNLLVVASTLMRQRVGGMVLCSNIGKSCPTVRVSVAATVCVCAGMCVCVCICASAHAFACVCVCVFACAGEVQDDFCRLDHRRHASLGECLLAPCAFAKGFGCNFWIDCKSATGGTDRGLPPDPACRSRNGRAVLLSVFAGCLHCSCSWEGCVSVVRAVSNKVTSTKPAAGPLIVLVHVDSPFCGLWFH